MQKKINEKPQSDTSKTETLEKVKTAITASLDKVDTSILGRIIPRNIIPPVYFLAALILMAVLDQFAPMSHLIYVPLRVFGGLLALGGLIVTACAAYAFKQAETPIKPFEKPTLLVTRGLFQYSRNPMYLGMIIILIGVWISLGSFSPVFVIPVFFIIMLEGFIKHEEPFLEKIFGDEYREYKSKVRRWM
ncbi:MAG: hypothetical protein HW411_1694 [Gammaproteobacteria bacterium]|nr:hypothetical protein [Gammaproteobacteria bacterium]